MWQLVVGFNLVIATCYLSIASLILVGLVRSRQLGSNGLALATAAIFLTCAVHHAEHGVHIWTIMVDAERALAIGDMFVSWHQVLIEGAGALAAVVYLGLRRSYKTLLHTPAMFEDAVRAEASERLRQMAYTDMLTGIPNRAAFRELSEGLSPDDSPVSVLFIDLDGFKAVNDLRGHSVGDDLLRVIAQRLAADLRSGEHLFRTGGDEFAVVGLGVGVDAAAAVADRLRRLIADGADGPAEGPRVGASVGCATGTARDGLDLLLREADADMYRIKARRQRGDTDPLVEPV